MPIAQMNVGVILYETIDPRMAGFMDNLDRVNALAENPRFLVNISVWASIVSLFDYVYRSDHRSIMVKRREWFEKPEGPYQVLWWVAEGHTPTVEEGLERLRHLVEHGPTPHAFTFKTVFPEKADTPIDLEPEPYCVGWA